MPLEQSEPTRHADRGKRPHALLSNKDLSDQMIHLGEIYDADDPRTSDVPKFINELIREYLIRQAENATEPTEGVEEIQTVDEDFQDLHRSDDVFEQAWGITKMALVRDSIKELDPTPGSFNFPPYKAIFRDKEGKEYPIEAREDQTYNINIFDPDTDKRLAFGNFRPWDRIHASNVKTLDPDNRRKGMMTAIYDLMNEIARTKGKRLKSDAGNLSDSSAPFWAKALGLPYEGYTEFQTKYRGQGFEWPEEGVYE